MFDIVKMWETALPVDVSCCTGESYGYNVKLLTLCSLVCILLNRVLPSWIIENGKF
jgi:hypothetical protein